MREMIANLVLGLALAVVVGLSILFAVTHNPVAPAAKGTPMTNITQALPATSEGRQILERENCLSCHSILGTGNPRYPLDGVGDRIRSDELSDWITGRGAATNKLSGAILRRKQKYQNLAPADLAALVQYLKDLK